jgi:uncharacterized protein (DUF2126 family)
VAELELDGASLQIAPALAFWPLVGDVASQESSGARLVDASSARLQLLLTAPPGEAAGTIAAGGWRVPMQPVHGTARRQLGSVLYRAFLPRPGLHPGLAPHDPLVLEWTRGGRALRVELHGWIPTGGAYAGLPGDEVEARRRRRERVVVSAGTPGELRPSRARGFVLDLRCGHAPSIQPPVAPHHAVVL